MKRDESLLGFSANGGWKCFNKQFDNFERRVWIFACIMQRGVIIVIGKVRDIGEVFEETLKDATRGVDVLTCPTKERVIADVPIVVVGCHSITVEYLPYTFLRKVVRITYVGQFVFDMHFC